MTRRHPFARTGGSLVIAVLCGFATVTCDAGASEIFGSVVDPRVRRGLEDLEEDDTTLESMEGVVLQATLIPDDAGERDVQEWFLEVDDGTTIAVALRAERSPTPPRSGMRVVIQGRSIGELESMARDGAVRRWPLWVGRPVSAVAATSNRMASIVFVATGVALAGWVVLRIALRRRLLASRDMVASNPAVRSQDSSVPGGGDVESLAAAVHDVEEPQGD